LAISQFLSFYIQFTSTLSTLFPTTSPPTYPISPLSLPDALPIWRSRPDDGRRGRRPPSGSASRREASRGSHREADPEGGRRPRRSEEHTSELQSRGHLVCRLLLEKKKDTETRCFLLRQKRFIGEY